MASANRIAARVRMTCCIARSMATDYTNVNDFAPDAKLARHSHRPPALSSNLEDSSSGHPLRGTRARRQRGGEEGAGAQDDPRTAKSRLPRRTSPGSIEQPGMIGRDFRPWLRQCLSR